MIPIKDNMPVDRFPIATVSLIVANVVVFAFGGPPPQTLTVGTFLSSIFIHRSVLALIGNIWFLWLFGNNVEDSMGPVRFVALYIAGGLIAQGVVLAFDPGLSQLPVGAAGAVAAVIGGYLLLYPRTRVLALVVIPFFFGVLEIPPLVMLAAWVAMQAVFAATGLIGGGTAAYLCYLGGFAFGLVSIRGLVTRRKPVPPTAAAYR